MRSIRDSILSLIAISLLAGAAGVHVSSLRAQENLPAKPDTGKGAAAGQHVFTSQCASCHGLDGRGGERGPNIAGSAKVQHLTPSQLAGIVSDGIPGTGMPAFRSLGAEQVRLVVRYLRTLQGAQEARSLPGNPALGKQIFFGKGECSTCHSIGGAGGFLGPDLSGYGSTKTSKAILEDIVKTERIVPAGYKLATATTRDGTRLEGVIRNEDNFSVQIQTSDGSFHFLQKSDLQNLELLNRPLMPTNYGERLNHGELNDVVSYLMSAASPREGEGTSRKAEDATE